MRYGFTWVAEGRQLRNDKVPHKKQGKSYCCHCGFLCYEVKQRNSEGSNRYTLGAVIFKHPSFLSTTTYQPAQHSSAQIQVRV